MKPLIILVSLLVVMVTSCQFVIAETLSTPQITNITTVDPWGHNSNFLNRGYKTTLNITIDSQNSGNFLVSASLFDNCNTPAGFTQEICALQAGTNYILIDLNVTSHAFVGIADLHIVISNADNHSPISSSDMQTYIKMLGDFDGNKLVNSQDIAILITAFNYYWTNNAISPQYQSCDINGDQKVSSSDLSAFLIAYNLFMTV